MTAMTPQIGAKNGEFGVSLGSPACGGRRGAFRLDYSRSVIEMRGTARRAAGLRWDRAKSAARRTENQSLAGAFRSDAAPQSCACRASDARAEISRTSMFMRLTPAFPPDLPPLPTIAL
jgi:hypothetical protein